MRCIPSSLLVWISIVATVFGGGGVTAVDNSYFVTHRDRCMASTQTPRRPRPLELCYWLGDESCCTPGNDALAKEKFAILMDVGAGCSPSDHTIRATYREVRDFMCLGCDPKEPSYRYLAREGDGVRPADPSAAADSFVWRICASFLYGANGTEGLWGGNGTKFDECGVNLPTPCESYVQYGFDSITKQFVASTVPVGPTDIDCGGDMIYPSNEYAADDPTNATYQRLAARNFLAALPQWLPDFAFIVINDSAPDYDPQAHPCFAGSEPRASGSRGRNAAAGPTIGSLLFVTAATAMTSLFLSAFLIDSY